MLWRGLLSPSLVITLYLLSFCYASRSLKSFSATDGPIEVMQVDQLQRLRDDHLSKAGLHTKLAQYLDQLLSHGPINNGAGLDELRTGLETMSSKEFCHEKEYRKHTFKVIKEMPYVGLFNDLLNITRFEGSAITFAKGYYWVIFDSLRSIARLDLQFRFRGQGNMLIPEDVGEAESQFEGIQYSPSTDTFLAVRETAQYEEHGLVPQIEEIKMADDLRSWSLVGKCPVRFNVKDENKGWESIVYFEENGGRDRYLLGLCESNHCDTNSGSDPPGRDTGNGRLVLTKYNGGVEGGDDPHNCHWDLVKVISIPKQANFHDYAAINFKGDRGRRVAVVSQEDAAVWVGEFDWSTMEFEGEGQVYHFPRDNNCEPVYCNVEGVSWIDDVRLVFASDASKSKQGWQCMPKDQSVHIMALP